MKANELWCRCNVKYSVIAEYTGRMGVETLKEV